MELTNTEREDRDWVATMVDTGRIDPMSEDKYRESINYSRESAYERGQRDFENHCGDQR